MRILIISQYFWPENFRINDLVSELVRRGHEVTVLTGVPNYPDGSIFEKFQKNPYFYSNHEGAKVIRVPLLPRGKCTTTLLLNYLSFALSASTLGLWKLRNFNFDVIFTCQLSPVTVGIPAVIIRAVKKIPMVFWVLDLWPESLQAVGVIRSKLFLFLIGKLVSSIYFRCDLILVQAKSFIPAIAKYNKNNSPIEYFPSWSDLNFNADNEAAAIEIPVQKDSFTIVFTGNIGQAQDFPAILAAAKILQNFAKIRWYIIGQGRATVWVAKEIKVSGLEDCVFLLGEFAVERMPSFIKHADALLVTLKDEPIFSLTIPAKLQAYLAAGRPILAMINGEAARVVQESGSGITCAAGDPVSLAHAVEKLLAMSKKERVEMGRRGLIYSAQEFDRSRLITKLELILDKMVALQS